MKGIHLNRATSMSEKGGLAKFWVRPSVRLDSSIGFSSKELKFMEMQVKENEAMIEEAWNEYFD